MNKLVVEGVYKNLKKNEVLTDVNMELEGGIITGIIGENGSGKSMLFRILAGLVNPTKGSILYNGKSRKEEVPRIGLVMDDVSMYPELTGKQNLQMLASINKIVDEKQIEEAIVRVGLDPNDKRTFRRYSLGMKHRLILAQAIMEKPDFLFLDEPTNAVDAEGVQVFYEIIKQEAERGVAVLISSHVNSDIKELSQVVYEMKKGKLSKK